jgi:hypothetical protein
MWQRGQQPRFGEREDLVGGRLSQPRVDALPGFEAPLDDREESRKARFSQADDIVTRNDPRLGKPVAPKRNKTHLRISPKKD